MNDLMSQLFQCEARAKLLELLLTAGVVASESELARLCGLSPRAIGKEVDHLQSVGLVRLESVGRCNLVSANERHPAYGPLKALFSITTLPSQDQQLRESLAAHGAPLAGVQPAQHFPLEKTLLMGLAAAKTDGTLLRVLPLVVAKNRCRIQWKDLKEGAHKDRLKSELGMLLELTGKLIHDDELQNQAQELRDRRRTGFRYFPEAKSRFERKVAEESSPEVARIWHFHMNMGEESFLTLLNKHLPELMHA